jgi:HPt (histidine-containing phosphotransfer) domain-containing protein
MAFRITTKRSGAVTVVAIDGQLRTAGVTELKKVCQSIEGSLCLDLANLQSIDAEGARAITELEAIGAALAGVSPYVDMLLKRASHS